MILNVGDRVRHTTFGEGLVTKYEPSARDVIVTIAFNCSGPKRLLLDHSPMEIIEKNTSPPKKITKTPLIPYIRNGTAEKHTEKIKENKSPRTYTTEFKIEVVKQALSEGRAVVRKQYKLPETTLRGWIKELG
jgi:hypothetical protein